MDHQIQNAVRRGGSIRCRRRRPYSVLHWSPWFLSFGPSWDRGRSCGCSPHREGLLVAEGLAAETLSGRRHHREHHVAAAADDMVVAADVAAAGDGGGGDVAAVADTAAATCRGQTWRSWSASGPVAARRQRCWRRQHRAGGCPSSAGCRSPAGEAGLAGGSVLDSWPWWSRHWNRGKIARSWSSDPPSRCLPWEKRRIDVSKLFLVDQIDMPKTERKNRTKAVETRRQDCVWNG